MFLLDGSSLWELSASYGEEETSQALEDMPRNLEPLHRRTLESIRWREKVDQSYSYLSPSAIHSLVLPFCPTDSSVHKITRPEWRLSVVGLSNV